VNAEGFFEFQERVKSARSSAKGSKSRKAAEGKTPAVPAPESVLTVSQLTAKVDKGIKSALPGTVFVRGEVSNARGRLASGHLYFTLKDSTACLNCVMWRDAAARVKFDVQDGVELIATGNVSVYAPQGKYQLQVTSLQPVGRGALELALRQLQAKLAAERLFDAERKKTIPAYPLRIAMITSRSTAALQDMLKVLRRYRWLKLMLYHVPVQGEGSGEKIAAAIADLNRRAADIGGADVILLARGGGSLEDLWAFNEEIVARAVADSRIPIVTGIGHEIDTSIADLVADHHAHTPTEAAQFVVKQWANVSDALGFSRTRLNRGLRQILQDFRQRLIAIERHEVFRRPMDRIQQLRQLLDDRQNTATLAIGHRLRRSLERLNSAGARLEKQHPRHLAAIGRERLFAMQSRLQRAFSGSLRMRAAKLDDLDHQLRALSPQAVLKRGYTITTLKKSGAILRSSAKLSPGDRLLTRFADGQAESIVEDSKQLPLFE
jgi:exodeoxyribonuclease VII large subunit